MIIRSIQGRGAVEVRSCGYGAVRYSIWMQDESEDEPAAAAGVIWGQPRDLRRLAGDRSPALVLGSGEICRIAIDAVSPNNHAASFLVLGGLPERAQARPRDGVLFI